MPEGFESDSGPALTSDLWDDVPTEDAGEALFQEAESGAMAGNGASPAASIGASHGNGTGPADGQRKLSSPDLRRE